MSRVSIILCVLATFVASACAAAEYSGPKRINKAIELLEAGQPVYYTYGAKGSDSPRTRDEMFELGKSLSKTWADLILYDMEHSALDFGLLRAFMLGLLEGGPTPSGHRTPAVITTLPLMGLDPESVKINGWMVQQALAAGIHGVHLCRARDPEAVREFVRQARYPVHRQGLDLEGGIEEGVRGMGSDGFARKIWGLTREEYFTVADTWPLNPDGEIMLGVKIEDPHALRNCESTARVAGLAFVESGPRDMGLSYGYLEGRADPPLPPEVVASNARILAAADAAGVAFLNNVLPDNVIAGIDGGIDIAAGGSQEAAEIGRRHTGRLMPW
ncbi:MAG: aldolase/citrate lyase family protein [Verrucomicrobia bacterium]|nr:aldolase/citrate lyase family protein [Verrucomicrobiota bacterium]